MQTSISITKKNHTTFGSSNKNQSANDKWNRIFSTEKIMHERRKMLKRNNLTIFLFKLSVFNFRVLHENATPFFSLSLFLLTSAQTISKCEITESGKRWGEKNTLPKTKQKDPGMQMRCQPSEHNKALTKISVCVTVKSIEPVHSIFICIFCAIDGSL